jgi:hypothetical protein
MKEGIILERRRRRLERGLQSDFSVVRERGGGRKRRRLRSWKRVGSQREESYGMCCRIAVRRCWERGRGLLEIWDMRRRERRGARRGPLLYVTLQPWWSYARCGDEGVNVLA